MDLRRPDGAPGLLVRPHADLPIVSLGFQVADWCETFLCHGPGDIEGEPLDIDDELLGFMVACYALHPETGRRLVVEATLSRLKGRAKSEIAGMFVCAEALAPTRFDHWATAGETSWWGYEYEAGEPVGRPVRSPYVRILATEEGQTGNTYDNVYAMLMHASKHHDEYAHLDIGTTRINTGMGGKIEPCTSGSASKDGGKESFAVADEVHLYVLPELQRMYATVSRNLAKRKAAEPWMLNTTTWFVPGESSVAEARYQEAVGIGQGRIRNRGVLYDHRHGTIPTGDGWDDDEQMIAGLRQAAGGAADWMNLEGYLGEIRKPDTQPDDAKRYFFNMLDSASEDLVEVDVWRALRRHTKLEPGDTIALGFDGSDAQDTTALVACRYPDWSVFVLGHWRRPDRAREWHVPRLEVSAVLEEVMRTYTVVGGFFDPPLWRSEIDQWAGEYGKDKVVGFPTFSDTRMTPATERWMALARAGTLGHDGHPVLEQHVAATRREKTRAGWRPAKKAANRKIDLHVAAILSAHALGDAIAKGRLTEEEPAEFSFAGFDDDDD